MCARSRRTFLQVSRQYMGLIWFTGSHSLPPLQERNRSGEGVSTRGSFRSTREKTLISMSRRRQRDGREISDHPDTEPGLS
jgi:hypothetical protein